MLRPISDSAFARIRRIYGKPALLSGSFAYAVYVLAQIDQFHGSISRTALNVVAGVIPCAVAGCALAPALVPLMSVLSVPSRGGRGLAVKAVKALALFGIVAALAVALDHLG